MARTKKEAALTPEERLQAALVPDWEWPYKLPENWCWVSFGTVCKFENGYAFKSDKFSNDVGVPVIRISNIKDNEVDIDSCVYTTENQVDDRFVVHYGDLLIAMSGATTGKNGIFLSNRKAYLNQRVGNIKLIDEAALHHKYRNFYIAEKTDEILRNAYGGAQPNISSNKICEMAFPLPPLPEQQRIVDRIESLFAKLDEAKEKVQAVVDSFETRKAAILHKAFTGELTAKWRNNSDIIWDYQKIKNCCNVGSGGTPSRKNSEYYNGNIPWIKTGEIEWNNIYDSEEKITESAIDNSSAKCYEPGAVLVAMYGMGVTRGKAGILCVRAATNQAVCVLEPAEDVLNNRFLLYYFMRNYWSIREKSVGGNQLNLSGTIIKELDIAIPPLDEQKEIVRILDNLFAKEQQAKEAADAVLDQIDLMKKSILARAFRGELGTNDTTDEPAVELIKSILQQKIEQGNKPKKQEKKGNHKEENIVAKTILEVLTVQKRATPEALKKGTELDIDDFYDQVKALIASKAITETREGNEVFLEVTHADRQVNN